MKGLDYNFTHLPDMHLIPSDFYKAQTIFNNLDLKPTPHPLQRGFVDSLSLRRIFLYDVTHRWHD